MYPRKLCAVRYSLLTFTWVVVLLAVFCHEMRFTEGASLMRKRAKKPAAKKPAAKRPPMKKAGTLARKKLDAYPKNFFPTSMYMEKGGTYENGAFVYDGHPSELVIQCLPPGQKAPKNRQMFDWRTTDGKGMVNNERFNVNAKTGELRINKPSSSTDGYYKCNVIMPDESILAHVHTVMTVTFPVFKLYAAFHVAVRSKCEDEISLQTMNSRKDEIKTKLCNGRTADACPYQVIMIKDEKTVQITNQTSTFKDGCFGRFNIERSVDKDFVLSSDCKTLVCWRNEYVRSLYDRDTVKPIQVFQELRQLSKEEYGSLVMMNFEKQEVGFCPDGYKTHNSTVCVPCEPGTEAKQQSDYTGASYCSKCPEGLHNDKFGQTKCVKCPIKTVVDSVSINCLAWKPIRLIVCHWVVDPKTVLGKADIDLKKVVEGSEEVDKELSDADGTGSWASKQWKKEKVQIGVVVGVNVLFLLCIGICLWKRYKKKTKYTALGEVDEEPEMQKMIFNAASEVYRKKAIVQELDAHQRDLYNKMSAKNREQYIDAIYEKEKLKHKLEEIKKDPEGGVRFSQ